MAKDSDKDKDFEETVKRLLKTPPKPHKPKEKPKDEKDQKGNHSSDR